MSLPVLSERAASTSSALVRCQGCTKCCEEGGPVYVKDDEVEILEKLGVPLVRVEGVTFIERLPDGSCPMLDRSNKRCRIYGSRPLCCRLFPLDIFLVGSELRWALYTDCPDERKSFSGDQGLATFMGLGSIGKLASILETLFEAKDIEFFREKEIVNKLIGLLEEADGDKWKILSEKVALLERANA